MNNVNDIDNIFLHLTKDQFIQKEEKIKNKIHVLELGNQVRKFFFQ